ncbi:MAG TPA: LacI family DNA-binding transcriptional regulator, partial [Armatimonadota bacterium]|nr:LacI family DNA-binding transcriptional regulator [Armatimonadota bacterium]
MEQGRGGNERTLKQIAEELNLSLMSVSRALNGHKGVSPATRHRVQEYVRQVQYRPNLAARTLVQRRSQVLGVIFPSLRQTFWAEIVLGIERVAKASGYTVLFAHSDDRADVEREEIETLLARQVDALLIASSDPEANLEALRQAHAPHRPVVLFDRYADGLEAPAVFCDDRDGARRLTEHLIGLGHRRIAHLAGPSGLSVARDRLRGYHDAMERAGLLPIVVACGFGEEAGRQGARALLDGEPVDAIFAAHDPIAFGVLDVLKERGLRVPEDIALVGYTDVEHAEHMAVPLTVMAQPTFAMGEATAQLALDLLAGRVSARTRLVLPAHLIVRQSCGA